jgi:hypothetical protein
MRAMNEAMFERFTSHWRDRDAAMAAYDAANVPGPLPRSVRIDLVQSARLMIPATATAGGERVSGGHRLDASRPVLSPV